MTCIQEELLLAGPLRVLALEAEPGVARHVLHLVARCPPHPWNREGKGRSVRDHTPGTKREKDLSVGDKVFGRLGIRLVVREGIM